MPIWVWISLFLYFVIQACISKKNSEHGGIYLWMLWLSTLMPGWTLISRYSKNLLFDGMVYDVIICIAYVSTMIVLGAGETFDIKQWVGLVLVLIGLFLMKLT